MARIERRAHSLFKRHRPNAIPVQGEFQSAFLIIHRRFPDPSLPPDEAPCARKPQRRKPPPTHRSWHQASNLAAESRELRQRAIRKRRNPLELTGLIRQQGRVLKVTSGANALQRPTMFSRGHGGPRYGASCDNVRRASADLGSPTRSGRERHSPHATKWPRLFSMPVP